MTKLQDKLQEPTIPQVEMYTIGTEKAELPAYLAHITIEVKDEVSSKDILGTWKRWFNGMKHFFTVKPLPPKK